MGVVIFNSRSSSDYGINIERPVSYEYAGRNYEKLHVPGRNGDLLLDNDSFDNVKREYEIAVGDNSTDFFDVASRVSNWLHSTNSYARLEDTYEPDIFRLAMYKEEGKINNILYKAGRITVAFDCKPQRFLKSGETVETLTATGTINNPTDQTAMPLLRIFGKGEVMIGNITITVNSDLPEGINYVDVDCDIMDAYSDGTNCNPYVSVSSLLFPTLHPGDNGIGLGNGITKVEITPRWWIV